MSKQENIEGAASSSNVKLTPSVKNEEPLPLTKRQQLLKDIRASILLLNEGVCINDDKLVSRAFRRNNMIRKRLTLGVLKSTAAEFYPAALTALNALQQQKMLDDSQEDADDAAELQAIKDTTEKTRLEVLKKEEERKKAEKEVNAKGGKTQKQKDEDKKKEAEKEKESALTEEEKAEKAKAEEAKLVETQKRKELEAERERKAALAAAQLVEVHGLVHLFVLYFIMDSGCNENAVGYCTELLQLVTANTHRRSMNLLSSHTYVLYSLTKERVGALESIRSELLLAHRTACLKHNIPAQSALIVCILRNFMHYNLYAQANKFRLGIKFPESTDNNIYARYLYYVAKINAVQLAYGEAHTHLVQSLRKAPSSCAFGFQQAAHKLLVIVQLLMGEIPERGIFNPNERLGKALSPYFKLTEAVRTGDVEGFAKVSESHKQVFIRDGVQSLIIRLRHNVIKTGLRKINVSYSKIAIKDVAAKLSIASEEEAEYLVAKAIHDGVIDAVIDRTSRFMYSKADLDVYGTNEPEEAYDKRIHFCMDVFADAVKAMRYPANKHKEADEEDNRMEMAMEKKRKEQEEKEKKKREDEEKRKSGKK